MSTRKSYFVRYYRDFANTYHLRWAPQDNKDAIAQLEEAGFEKITRKEAESLVTDEKYRRKYDSSMSGYADDTIIPWCFDEFYDDWCEPGEDCNWCKFVRKGNLIVEKGA